MRRHRKEYPADPHALRGAAAEGQPEGIIEALISLPPHAPVPFTQGETEDLRDLLAKVVEKLPSLDRFIIDSILFEKKSLRELEYILSIPKTTIARRRDEILERLRNQIEERPIVQEYLNG